jgi:hypothetical protein
VTTDIDLTERSTVTAAAEHTSCRLGDEVVILNLRAGVYYGLNPLAAQIWDLIRRPRRVDEIRDVLLEEYDVDAEGCERDVLALLREMATHDLITVDGDGAA